MKNCVVSILGNTKLTALQKLEFIMGFVPKLVQLLEGSTIWKQDKNLFHGSFHTMYESIKCVANPGFFEVDDYKTVLEKFPMSGFPPTLKELPAFVKSKLWDNFIKLKDLKDQ
jgi:hypothetical protein